MRLHLFDDVQGKQAQERGFASSGKIVENGHDSFEAMEDFLLPLCQSQAEISLSKCEQPLSIRAQEVIPDTCDGLFCSCSHPSLECWSCRSISEQSKQVCACKLQC